VFGPDARALGSVHTLGLVIYQPRRSARWRALWGGFDRRGRLWPGATVGEPSGPNLMMAAWIAFAGPLAVVVRLLSVRSNLIPSAWRPVVHVAPLPIRCLAGGKQFSPSPQGLWRGAGGVFLLGPVRPVSCCLAAFAARVFSMTPTQPAAILAGAALNGCRRCTCRGCYAGCRLSGVPTLFAACHTLAIVRSASGVGPCMPYCAQTHAGS